MIESFIHRSRTLHHYQSNPLHDGIEDLTAYLVDRGYTPSTIHLYIRAAAHFGRWLEQQRVEPASITESVVYSFLNEHLPTCQCSPRSIRSLKELRPVLRHLVRALRKTGRIPTLSLPVTPIDQEVMNFEEYMRAVCGLAEETILYRTRYVREFLTAMYGQAPLNFKDLAPRDIIKFVSVRSRDCKPGSINVLACSLRSYLRFLYLWGKIERDISTAIPAAAEWKKAHLPRTLSEEQIEQFFSVFDCSTPTGQRDYAICLCLYELGLRRSEVAGLCLNDIDWRKGTLHISSTKTKRSRLLPLPHRLGLAIVDYLRNGRPESVDRHVFLRHVAPKGLGIGPGVVQNALDRTISRALLPHRFGPHAFRHTFASRMCDSGATFKEIADLLGHQEIDTVSIYTKVNLSQLSRVALPWPEVQP